MCGGSELRRSASPPSVDAFCEGVCRGVARCQAAARRGAPATTACRTDPANRGLATVRPEAAAVVTGCLAGLDCATISTARYDACWDRARQQTKPSPHLRDVLSRVFDVRCSSAATRSRSRTARRDLDIWTDAFLDELAACARKPTCEEVDACLEARFGGT